MLKQSPFKLLDSYDKEDKDIFFGRETEIEALYQMTYQTNLILVYGMSGTGKTSLIKCGLANRFDSSDWFDVYIRRQENINKALVRELRAKDTMKSFEEGYNVREMIHSLYLDHLRPIYLLFDQFEELFILGTASEQETFIETVKNILDANLACKIVISIREEYLAHLSEFERKVPKLFDKRLRIEPMNRANARRVILETARNPRFNIQLCYDEIAEEIIDNVTEGIGRVQLPYLQVLLDKMYRLAYEQDPNNIVFDEELIAKVGTIKDVLADFLDEQLEVFAREVDRRDMAVLWLKTFVSDKGTKIPVKREDLPSLSPIDMSTTRISVFLEFFVNRRILRPLDNDQYELAHDSLAMQIFEARPQGIPLPKELPAHDLPANPFVGFEPYSQEMAAIFFGRDKEIRELFDTIINEMENRTTLVLGPMGIGKTSLIRAGLMPRIESLCSVRYIRCNRELIDSAPVRKMLSVEPQPNQEPMLLQIAYRWDDKIPQQVDRKVLIFDQFEEFFIWVQDPAQILHLNLHIANLLESRRNTDLVIVLRDEFFTQIQDLEAFVPNILEEQVRVRPVSQETAVEVIKKASAEAGMVIEDPMVIDKIIQNVTENGKVNLTYLQLYMDRLYRVSAEAPSG